MEKNSENIFGTTGTQQMVKLSENKKENEKLCTVRKVAENKIMDWSRPSLTKPLERMVRRTNDIADSAYL